MEKVIRNGKVAVLISPGFGAGWYTWNRKVKELLFNPKLVEMVEAGRSDEIDSCWVNDNLGIENVYCGGADNLHIHWIDEGATFTIREHDGSETLMLLSDLTIIA